MKYAEYIICFGNCSNIFSNVKRLHIGFIVGYVSYIISLNFLLNLLLRKYFVPKRQEFACLGKIIAA